jgi:nucleoid-associated protein YgaU
MSALPAEFLPAEPESGPVPPMRRQFGASRRPFTVVPGQAGTAERQAGAAERQAGAAERQAGAAERRTSTVERHAGSKQHRSGPRSRPSGPRSRPAGVRACSAALRAEPAALAETPALTEALALTKATALAGPSVLAEHPPVLAPAPVAESPRPHLTGLGRSVLVACAVIVATLLWFAAASVARAADHSGTPRPAGHAGAVQVVVQPGQTLWSIALQADPSADPRLAVQHIVAMNSLAGENLSAGQHLWVPRG